MDRLVVYSVMMRLRCSSPTLVTPDQHGRHSTHGTTSTTSTKEQRKKQKRQKEIRSIVKSINYIDNPNKRERAHQFSILHPTDNLPPLSTSAHHNSAPNLSSECSNTNNDDDSEYDSESEAMYLSQRMNSESHDDSSRGDVSSLKKGQHPSNKTAPMPLWGRPRLDGNWQRYFTTNKKHPIATYYDFRNPHYMPPEGFASTIGGHTPPLFLQELAHLASLLFAVSLSTLRNDIEGAESPLAMYTPGEPWPEVDPDLDEPVKLFGLSSIGTKIKTFLSIGKTAEERTKWNAARPLPVIGGVSDAEIHFLQMARGPYAKTQLCWNWLSEFIIREHLAGSLGKVGPPIVSRVIQFLGDGMIYYNHARKIMFIPFPFVHAQISVMFIVIMIPAIPFLMDQYTDE